MELLQRDFANITGLLIVFRAVAEPQNPAKFTKTLQKPRNSVEILSNTCLYNMFEIYFSYRGYLFAVNLQIYLRTSSLKRANNVPKLPGVTLLAESLRSFLDKSGKRKRLCRHLQVPLICRSSSVLDESDKFYTG